MRLKNWKFTKKKPFLLKKISCLNNTFEILVNFEILAIFEISNGYFHEMVINIGIFFVIIIQDNVLFILVEFESDRIRPRESAKNGQIGAHGLNSKILLRLFRLGDLLHPTFNRL